MTKRLVRVTQWVEVETDDSKFDEDFIAEFTANFYHYDTMEEHVEHIAQLHARGIFQSYPNEFIEGYGPASDMGISARVVDGEEEFERVV